MPVNHHLKKRVLAVAVTTACLNMSITTPAQAQQESGGLLEEVIVTATRREQTVQEIPYTR